MGARGRRGSQAQTGSARASGHTEPGWDQVHAHVPFIHVADVTASIGFYEQLGLHVTATHPTTTPDPDWASLEAHEAQLMLARADQPIDALTSRPLYLFARDLFRLRDRLIAAGIDAGDISDGSPVPAVEMRVEDPDRYVLMIALNDPDGADDDKPQA